MVETLEDDDDETFLEELRDAAREHDPVPPEVVEAAKRAIARRRAPDHSDDHRSETTGDSPPGSANP
jgi:hypothetical protein